MGYPTKVQLIKRKTSRQWYVNFPAVLAQAMEFAKGEVVEWVVEDRTTLTPRRTTLVGRIRKDAKLFHPPDDADQPVVGAKRKYGEQAPTPEMLRRKQKGGITHCWKKGQTPATGWKPVPHKLGYRRISIVRVPQAVDYSSRSAKICSAFFRRRSARASCNSGRWRARMEVANKAALIAPALPIASVATGTPGGI